MRPRLLEGAQNENTLCLAAANSICVARLAARLVSASLSIITAVFIVQGQRQRRTTRTQALLQAHHARVCIPPGTARLTRARNFMLIKSASRSLAHSTTSRCHRVFVRLAYDDTLTRTIPSPDVSSRERKTNP